MFYMLQKIFFFSIVAMHPLTEIYSGQRIIRQFHHCATTTEYTYTHLDGIAHYCNGMCSTFTSILLVVQ